MKQLVNRFNKGLNKDINKVNFPNDAIYHGQNTRIISDKGNDMFSITNVEGNTLNVNLSEYNDDFVVIGYVCMRDDVILFLAAEDDSGKGKILLLKNIKDSFTVFTLYENDNIEFYSDTPIQEDMAVSRYGTKSEIALSKYKTEVAANRALVLINQMEGEA